METKIDWTRCPDDVRTRKYQTCGKQNSWLWTQQEKLKFTSLIISPGTPAVKCLLIMTLLSVQLYSPTKRSALWPCTIHGRLLQPKHGVPAVWLPLSTCLCFALMGGFNLVGQQWQSCLRHHENNGARDHRNCILIGPKSWWRLEQSVFWVLIGLWPETDGNVQHC